MSVKATDFFRALDDSGLDVYETRYLLRVWRRGTCWEKLDGIAKATRMSIGKASQVKKDLTAKGWLKEVVADGRVAYQVDIPNVVVFHQVKSDVAEFHEVKPEFHQVKSNFHVVSALPLIDQNEDHPIKYIQPEPGDSPSQVDPELIAAREATFGLIAFWEELTKRKRPDDETLFREKWLKPFNEIWIACGRNLDTAKAKVQAVRNSILAGGGRIFDPSKLPAHVQALVDVELLPMTAALNGNGHSNGRVNFRNDPEAREAHNRAVFAQVAAEYESGEWTPWTV